MTDRIQRGKPIYKTPCLFAMKGKLCKIEERKTRALWMFPIEIVMMEKAFTTGIEAMIAEYPNWLFHNGEKAMGRLA